LAIEPQKTPREATITSTTTALAGRRMLVTGATGFIGARLCAHLRDAGAEVHALSRNEAPEGGGSIQWHRGDLVDAEATEALVRSIDPDTVFHLASQVSGAPGHELVRTMLECNLLGTVNLLSAVQATGCRRMVATGTVVEPREDEPASSPYAAAKGAGTDHARMFHALYGTPVVCLRLAMVYGPGQEDPKKLIPHVVENLLRGESPQLSSGTWEVDWVYVDDVIQALILASVAEGVEGEVLDVGSGDVASVRSVVEHLASIIESEAHPSFGAMEDRPLTRSVSTDLTSTRRLLGWSAGTSLRDGLRNTVKWHSMRIPSVLWFLDAASIPV
jgi:UDP-glucose 4-epimerase